MVAPEAMGRTDDIVLAAATMVILAMSVFGLDAIVFRKKRAATPDRTSPKHRVAYIFEDEPDESDADVSRRPSR